MAKITTITNPLTGQPAQVDQLEHTAQEIDDAIARALPGGAIDITLQNNDPRRWGIGGVSKELTSSDDLNTIFENGLYRWGSSVPQNAPTEWPTSYPAYCMMRVWCYGVGDAIQEISSLNYDFKYTMKRICRNNVWTIEWDNPPMELGVEYRTTERYLGKPVYALCANFGANIDGSSMYFGENVLNIVRGQAYGGQGNLTYPWYNGNAINNWTAFFDFLVYTDTSDNIKKVKVTCRASSDASNSYSTNYVVLHYTKSTD